MLPPAPDRRGSASALAVLLLVATGCGPAPQTYRSRASYSLVVRQLAEAKGSPADSVVLRFAAMVDRLEPRRPYKFVVTLSGQIVVAPLPADEPGDRHAHAILARGRAVLTAGILVLAVPPLSSPDGNGTPGLGAPVGPPTRKVLLDQRSSSYCPSFASLEHARRALVRLGLSSSEIGLVDRAPACLP